MCKATRSARRSSAEPLESRRLLAATITGGVLVATGTDGADEISVRRVLSDDVVVTINGAAQTFDMDDFTGVRLDGLAGNDRFKLLDPLVSPVVRNTTVVGGAGSDTIDYSTRTTGITLLYNTEGGAVGGSSVTQGAQTDRFTSVETLLGGSGNDTFTYGSSGPPEESVDGQPAEEDTEIRIEGRGGNDLFVDSLATFQWLRGVTLLGGDGNDTFDADEIGNEQYFGGPGNDLFRFHNESGPDPRFSGGDGIDTIDLSDTFLLGGLTDMNRTPDIENAVGIREMVIGNALGNRLEALQVQSDPVTIIGGDGNDTIIGGSAADLLQGEAGNDSLVGNAGNDTLDGGPGTDTLSGGTGINVFIDGEVIGGDPTVPTIAIESGILAAVGTGGNDTFTIRRTGMDNVIVTVNALSREFDMDDFTGVRLEGLGGSDTFRLVDPLVSPVVRNTTVIGGSGNDRLVYSARTAPLHFRIDPVAPTSTVTSGVQVDQFVAVETLVGGSGDDSFVLAQEDRNRTDQTVSFRLEGRDGNDVFVDSIYPTSDAYGFVTMLGGAGDDRFFDESDQRFTREVFFGEAGNDSVRKERAAGTFDGGSGIDTLHFLGGGGGDLRKFPGFENATATYSSGGTTDAPIHLTGTDGPNHLSISGSGTIEGLGGDDTLVGSEQDDTLEGGDGNDLLLGIWGNDALDGGPGTDAADGGVGDDTITNAEIVPGVGQIRIANRVLTAEGTWGGERITIERVGIDNVIVRIDGFAREFDMDDFDGVLLRGGAGYDQITVVDSLLTPVERKVTLEGGDGNDILDGHDGNDVLRGGNGNDQIRGGAGRNALFGDAGDDFLSASSAALPTFMDGGAGNDFLYADNGIKDTVLGGPGDDDEATVDTLDETLGIEHLLVR